MILLSISFGLLVSVPPFVQPVDQEILTTCCKAQSQRIGSRSFREMPARRRLTGLSTSSVPFGARAGFQPTAELTSGGDGKPHSNMAPDAESKNGPPPGAPGRSDRFLSGGATSLAVAPGLCIALPCYSRMSPAVESDRIWPALNKVKK